MGLIDAVKDRMGVGKCSDPEHHHPEQFQGTQTTTGNTTNTKTGTMPQTTETTRSTGTGTHHTQTTHQSGASGNYQQGVNPHFDGAAGKMAEAQEAARIAEVNAAKAHRELDSVSEIKMESERSNSRLAELERELAGLRNSGVDLRAKQAEVDAAKRRAQEIHQRMMEAERRAREHESLIPEKERAAQQAQGAYHQHAKGIEPIEAELADIQRAKAEAEQRYHHHHKALSDFEGTHGPKEAQVARLRQELENHAKAKKEAEAALAAVEMRHRDAHGKLRDAQGDYEMSLKQREGLHHHHQSAKKYLDDLNAREAALRQRLGEHRGLLGEHEGRARTAAQEAEAVRAAAAQHRQGINPLQQEASQHTDAIRQAEAGLGDAALQQRREREREAALARELEGHRRTTATTETETQRRVGEYEKYKERADEANARKEQLHEEAKRMGDMGDRGADSKLHQLEQRLENVDIGSLKNTTTRNTTTRTVEE